jgi:Putative FMN-binding domain
MYDSAKYRVDPADAEAFVQGQHHGTLVAIGADGWPQVTILPFVKTGDLIELHALQADSTFAALQQNPKVTFLVEDYLAWTPHFFQSERDAGQASLQFLAVAFECEASWSTDPSEVAGALSRLLHAYEGADATYEPIEDGQFYGGRLRRLATIRLHVLRSQAKFKAGGSGTEVKQKTIAGLRARREPGDERAAEVIEATL